jgi:hypothetical protein
VTRTTTTQTKEDCATIFGCHVEDRATETETLAACTIAPAVKPREGGAEPKLRPRVPPNNNPQCISGDAIIFPVNPADASGIRNYLQMSNNPATLKPWLEVTTEVKSARASFTAFFHVKGFTQNVVDNLMGPGKVPFGVSHAQ